MIKHLYEQSKYKNIIHDVDGVYIPLDLCCKNIAVSLSGGADSTLLTYLLCEILQKNKVHNVTVHCISHIRCWKEKPWQEHDSQKIFKCLTDIFPEIQFKRHINFIPPDLEWGSKGPSIVDEYGKLTSGDVIEIRSFAEYIGNKEFIDAYYNAVTKNPPIEIENKMNHRDIDASPETFNLAITEHMGKLSCHPFRFIDKSWIYKQYVDKNLLDLFLLTRSCEGTFENITYKNYVTGQYVPICGKCFWCLERIWAVNQYE
jgi:hypothetical protein